MRHGELLRHLSALADGELLLHAAKVVSSRLLGFLDDELASLHLVLALHHHCCFACGQRQVQRGYTQRRAINNIYRGGRRRESQVAQGKAQGAEGIARRRQLHVLYRLRV